MQRGIAAGGRIQSGLTNHVVSARGSCAILAVEPPAIVRAGATEDPSDVIEIVANRPDQAQKIDRRIYSVKQNPHSAAEDGIQLLRGLPGVTISTDDQLMLLGAPNVTVMIDGRTITEQNLTQFLRSLHGSDIERIEIMTNPSAQYPAQGTGGIINIVLRRKRSNGLAGSLMGELSTFASANGSATVKYRKGRWTYELNVNGTRGRNSRTSHKKFRRFEAIAGGAATSDSEDGRSSAYLDMSDTSFKITRTIGKQTSVSLKSSAGTWRAWSDADARFTGLTADFRSFAEQQHTSAVGPYFSEELAFDHKGRKEGETLQASLKFYDNPIFRSRTEVNSPEIGSFLADEATSEQTADLKIDWVHPIGKAEILSAGGEGTITRSRQDYAFTSSGGEPALGPDLSGGYRVLTRAFDLYATFQQPIGSWTAMPGIRLEYGNQRASSSGHAPFSYNRANIFPTLHLEHQLTRSLDLTLSYTRRINYIDVAQLRPYPVIESVDTMRVGNPRLRDQKTDAYELNLHFHRARLDAGVIVYDRETSRLIVPRYTIASGVNLVTSINAGREAERGGEIDLSTPLSRRLKASASINLFDNLMPDGFGRSRMFRYTTNSTLEWDGPGHGHRPGDIAQLQLQFNSPYRYYEFHAHGWRSFSLSYTHSFTRRLSLTATANRVGVMHEGHELIAPLVQEYYAGRQMPEFKLKLLRTFGTQ